jgi:hypothetical protein
MTTLYQFTPTVDQNFSFLPTFDGQEYNVIVTWNVFGQRWVVNVYNLQGQLYFQKPMTASPDDYNINLAEGYFTTSTLVYRKSTNNFEVSP